MTRAAKRELIINKAAELGLVLITAKKHKIPMSNIVIDRNNDMQAINALYQFVNQHNKTAESVFDTFGWNPTWGATFKNGGRNTPGSYADNALGYCVEIG